MWEQRESREEDSGDQGQAQLGFSAGVAPSTFLRDVLGQLQRNCHVLGAEAGPPEGRELRGPHQAEVSGRRIDQGLAGEKP